MSRFANVKLALGQVAALALLGHIKSAKKYLSPQLVVKGTKRGKLSRGRPWHKEVLLTVGRPNYDERAFVKQAMKDGYSFPIQQIMVRYYRNGR